MKSENSIRLYSVGFDEIRSYILAFAFCIGNIVLPQIAHYFPHGGQIWLPIYFFTLIGAYKYGWKVGLLTAVASPMVNSLLFGMPAVAMLPAIFMKSILLAVFAGLSARKFGKASLWMIALVVISYQVVGSLGEWMLKGDFYLAIQDFRIGIPGMIMQILGGWAIINHVIRK